MYRRKEYITIWILGHIAQPYVKALPLTYPYNLSQDYRRIYNQVMGTHPQPRSTHLISTQYSKTLTASTKVQLLKEKNNRFCPQP